LASTSYIASRPLSFSAWSWLLNEPACSTICPWAARKPVQQRSRAASAPRLARQHLVEVVTCRDPPSPVQRVFSPDCATGGSTVSAGVRSQVAGCMVHAERDRGPSASPRPNPVSR
jgi:hypothetical protein